MQTTAHARLKPALLPRAFAIALAASGLGLCFCAVAQTAPLPESPPSGAPKGIEQLTEHLLHEDASTRIEELRIGGQTRRIEVNTKGALPVYLVQPQHANQPGADNGGSAGKSAWRLFSF
jgi:hypothetical protein